MRRNVVIALVALIVAGAAVAGIARAGDGGGQVTQRQVLRLIQTASHDAIVDNPPKGFGVADVDVFNGPLVWASHHQHAGTIDGQCTVVTAANGGRQECQISLLLHGGIVTLAGPFFGNGRAQMAVTGGTGPFRNARGQARIGVSPSGEQADIRLELLP